MKTRLDFNKIAKGLGAARAGKVRASAGYFGALGLLAELEHRLRIPPGGGRPTDPAWTERRLVPLTPGTLERLDEITTRLRELEGLHLEPMQLAALMIEESAARLTSAALQKKARRPSNPRT